MICAEQTGPDIGLLRSAPSNINPFVPNVPQVEHSVKPSAK